MSSDDKIHVRYEAEIPSGQTLWLRQIASIIRFELKKNFLSKRAILIYLCAITPIIMLSPALLFRSRAFGHHKAEAQIIFANIFDGPILRMAVFFGCAWIFMNLFRGEVVDKSLHYYFLSAVRREILVMGKYLSGLIGSIILFCMTTTGCLIIFYIALGSPENKDLLLNSGGLKNAFVYLGITTLACIGYGAVFLVIGLFFRNPIIPAALIYGWEWLNIFLPPILKKISIVFYLNSLTPVPIPGGPFALVADPSPPWVAIPGLIILTLAVLTLASFRIRWLEITYGSD